MRMFEFGTLGGGLLTMAIASMGSVDPCMGTGQSCSYVGGFKFLSGVASVSLFTASVLLSHEAEKAEMEAEDQELKLKTYQNLRDELFMQKQLEADEVSIEDEILGRLGLSQPMNAIAPATAQTFNVPAVPMSVPQLAQFTIPQPAQNTVQAGSVVSDAAIAGSLPVQPVAQPQMMLPDGARLIQAADIGDINKYPVIMVIASPGNGKTATMRYVMSQLPGIKVFSSHKAEQFDTQYFDLCFGYNPHTDQSRWIGDDTTTMTMGDRDFSWIKTNQDGIGTVSEFVWGVFAEISNRQLLGATRVKSLPFYRCFFDEASFTYTTAYRNPLNPETLKWGQSMVSGSNALTFMDARSHRCQMFYAAQTESVETIGLKNMSAMRDDAWHLYPGREAISKAKEGKKPQLAQWLESRLNQGHAIAILEKQGIFWEVLNLPKISELEFIPQGEPVDAIAVESKGASTYDLMQQAKG